MMKQLSVCLCLYVCLFATIFASQLHCTINRVSPYISTIVTAVTACNFTRLCLCKSGKSENLECMVECLIVSSMMRQLSSNYWNAALDSRTANNPNTIRWTSHCLFWQTRGRSSAVRTNRPRGPTTEAVNSCQWGRIVNYFTATSDMPRVTNEKSVRFC
jgi:hypothetical protein